MKGIGFPRRKGPTESVRSIRRTDQPGPKFNYELFNRNNFNIRYWSWNYRGCWPFTLVIVERVSSLTDSIKNGTSLKLGNFYNPIDTFPRSTRMRFQRLLSGTPLGIGMVFIHQTFPEQGCLAGTFL